jgi:hypothetical protein
MGLFGNGIDRGALNFMKLNADAVHARQTAGAAAARGPAVPLPAWAGQAPTQTPTQTPSQPYAPPQLALGAPIGAVSPVQVNNQALVNALRAPAAPQAIGGNNG